MKMRVCRYVDWDGHDHGCGEAFVVRPNKPGLIWQCDECGADDVAMIGVNLRDANGALVGIPEHLLAVGDLVGVDQISELRGGRGN